MTELEILKEKCLDVHGEPNDSATHGEMERIKYLEGQPPKTEPEGVAPEPAAGPKEGVKPVESVITPPEATGQAPKPTQVKPATVKKKGNKKDER